VTLSAAQRAVLWRRWKAGQLLHVIGRAFGKPHRTRRQFVTETRSVQGFWFRAKTEKQNRQRGVAFLPWNETEARTNTRQHRAAVSVQSQPAKETNVIVLRPNLQLPDEAS
jgi:hypothetical protein